MVDRTKEEVAGAVATNLGWVNPKTGELLVSIRGLSGAIQWSKGPIDVSKTKKKFEVVETAEDLTVDEAKLDDTIKVVESVVEAPAVEVVEPVVEAPKVVKKATKKTAKKTTPTQE